MSTAAPTAWSAAELRDWRGWLMLPLTPLSVIVVAFVAANWAWEESFASQFLADWWRFYRRALAQALTRGTFWPRSGWFYEAGMITWSWDSRVQAWTDLGGRVSIRSH